MRVEFEIPTSLPSVANLRESWHAKARRAKKHRRDAALLCGMSASHRLLNGVRARGATITLVRVGARRIDDDNLAAAFKAVRDGLADALRIDDGSRLLRWSYDQRTGQPDTVHVAIYVPEATT